MSMSKKNWIYCGTCEQNVLQGVDTDFSYTMPQSYALVGQEIPVEHAHVILPGGDVLYHVHGINEMTGEWIQDAWPLTLID